MLVGGYDSVFVCMDVRVSVCVSVDVCVGAIVSVCECVSLCVNVSAYVCQCICVSNQHYFILIFFSIHLKGFNLFYF